MKNIFKLCIYYLVCIILLAPKMHFAGSGSSKADDDHIDLYDESLSNSNNENQEIAIIDYGVTTVVDISYDVADLPNVPQQQEHELLVKAKPVVVMSHKQSTIPNKVVVFDKECLVGMTLQERHEFLCKTILHGDIDTIKIILEYPVDCNALYNLSKEITFMVTPVQLATFVQNGKDIVDLLIEKGGAKLEKEGLYYNKCHPTRQFPMTFFTALIFPKAFILQSFCQNIRNISDEDRVALLQKCTKNDIRFINCFLSFTSMCFDEHVFFQLQYPLFSKALIEYCADEIQNDLTLLKNIYYMFSRIKDIDTIKNAMTCFCDLLNQGIPLNTPLQGNYGEMGKLLDIYGYALVCRDTETCGIKIEGFPSNLSVLVPFIKMLILYGARRSNGYDNNRNDCYRIDVLFGYKFPDCFYCSYDKKTGKELDELETIQHSTASAIYLEKLRACTKLCHLPNMPQDFSRDLRLLPILYLAYNDDQSCCDFIEKMLQIVKNRALTFGLLDNKELAIKLRCTLGSTAKASKYMALLQ